MKITARMVLAQLDSGGAVFKYDGDALHPVSIPTETWESRGRPTVIHVEVTSEDE